MGLFSRKKPITTDARDRVEPVVRNDVGDVLSSDLVLNGQIFSEVPSASGAVINQYTAMRVSAVYAAVRLIAGAVATTPCSFYRKTDGWREKANDHPYWWLFNEQPTPRFTAATFWEYVTGMVLLRGDAICYIERGGYGGGIRGIIPIPRDNVQIIRQGRKLVYRITEEMENGEQGYFVANQADVLHFPGVGFDGTSSQSVISWGARQAIGIAIKADEHSAQMFGSGASIQYAVKTDKTMTTDQQDQFRAAWVAKYSGKGVASMPLVLTEGLELQELSMTSVDAQLLESRRFQVVDIARAFGIPPHMIGETTASTSWGSGIEQMAIGFTKWTMRPHFRRYEQELNRKLFPTREAVFVEFNTDGQLEGDSKAQSEYFGKALGGPGSQGWMALNEVRALKNLPPVVGGDEVYMPSAPYTAPNNKETPNEADDESTDSTAGA